MFLRHMHTFRALAIFMVVANHCFPLFGSLSNDPLTRLVVEALSNATVLFIFVAGFLFQHLSARFSYPAYLTKKARVVIMPYLVMSTPLIGLQAWRGTGVFDPAGPMAEASMSTKVMSAYMFGTAVEAFWFIPMIAIFYLAAPLFIAIDRNRRGYWILVPLFLLSILVHRPVHVHNIFHAGIYLLFPYLFGMWCSRHRKGIEAVVAYYIRPLVVLTMVLLAFNALAGDTVGAVASASPFSTENGIIETSLLLKIPSCLVVMHLFKRWDKPLFALGNKLASLSFGIFFIHGYVLAGVTMVLSKLSIDLADGTWWGLLVMTGLVTALCMAAIIGIKRVTGRSSRMLIGC